MAVPGIRGTDNSHCCHIPNGPIYSNVLFWDCNAYILTSASKCLVTLVLWKLYLLTICFMVLVITYGVQIWIFAGSLIPSSNCSPKLCLERNYANSSTYEPWIKRMHISIIIKKWGKKKVIDDWKRTNITMIGLEITS